MSAGLNDDLLYGAKPIAEFLFGSEKHTRKVYNLVEKEEIPIFRMGGTICARKSAIFNWIQKQESRQAS